MNEWLVFLNWFSWEKTFLALLSLATAISLCESNGLLPSSWSRLVNRNQASKTIEVLRGLGIDVPRLRQVNAAARVAENVPGTTLEARVRARLKLATIQGNFSVGSTRSLPTKSFIDAMGACTNPATARALAGDLYAHWGNILREPTTRVATVDFVVTPKSGCPFLGYEFAKLVDKPLVVFNALPKFGVKSFNFRSNFDCQEVPEPGLRALIVDDSSTGGAKACAAVEALRNAGYLVSDFLVLFEPMLKAGESANAAVKLNQMDVTLRSIFKI